MLTIQNTTATNVFRPTPMLANRFGHSEPSKPPHASSETMSPRQIWSDFSTMEAADTGLRLKKHPRELSAVASMIPDLSTKQKIHIAQGVGHFKTRNAQKALFEPLLQDTHPKVLYTTLIKMRALARTSEIGEKAWFQPNCNLKQPTPPLLTRLGQKFLGKAPQKPLNYIQAHGPLTRFYELHKTADMDAIHLLETAAHNPLLHQSAYANTLRAELVPQILKIQTTRLTVVPRVNGNLYVPQKEMNDLLTRQVNLMTQLPFTGKPSTWGKLTGHRSYQDCLDQLTQRVSNAPLDEAPKAKLLSQLQQANPATSQSEG